MIKKVMVSCAHELTPGEVKEQVKANGGFFALKKAGDKLSLQCATCSICDEPLSIVALLQLYPTEPKLQTQLPAKLKEIAAELEEYSSSLAYKEIKEAIGKIEAPFKVFISPERCKFDESPSHKEKEVTNVHPLIPIDKEIAEYKNPEIIKKLQAQKTRYCAIRKVRGDGNCYYRAVAYRYLELLLSLGCEYIEAFYYKVKSQSLYFNFDKEASLLCPTILGHLEQLINARRKAGSEKTALDMLHNIFDCSEKFDKAIVKAMRLVTKNYIEKNYKEKFDGIELEAVINADATGENVKLENYLKNKILREGEGACVVTLMVLPQALQLNINVYFFGQMEGGELGTYFALVPQNLSAKNKLNLYKHEINIRNMNSHHDILYTHYWSKSRQSDAPIQDEQASGSPSKRVLKDKFERDKMRCKVGFRECCEDIAGLVDTYLGQAERQYEKNPEDMPSMAMLKAKEQKLRNFIESWKKGSLEKAGDSPTHAAENPSSEEKNGGSIDSIVLASILEISAGAGDFVLSFKADIPTLNKSKASLSEVKGIVKKETVKDLLVKAKARCCHGGCKAPLDQGKNLLFLPCGCIYHKSCLRSHCCGANKLVIETGKFKMVSLFECPAHKKPIPSKIALMIFTTLEVEILANNLMRIIKKERAVGMGNVSICHWCKGITVNKDYIVICKNDHMLCPECYHKFKGDTVMACKSLGCMAEKSLREVKQSKRLF